MARTAIMPVPSIPVMMFAALLGCGSPARSEFLTPVYDACFTVDDCVETATLCEELIVEFGGFDYVNSICTLNCVAEGSVSADCPRAYVGLLGSCYPSSVAGGIDDTLVCFDPCVFDEGCQQGFRCLGATALCGADLDSCPVDENDAICVPGPE
ncbi:MAG: hypothetical protein WBN14_00635 [Polyangiales bacterium]